jgi:hypothetical protein
VNARAASRSIVSSTSVTAARPDDPPSPDRTAARARAAAGRRSTSPNPSGQPTRKPYLRAQAHLRKALAARLCTGDPEPYLAHAIRTGRLAISEDPLEAKQQLLADWWTTAGRAPSGSVMLAYRGSDVDELNEAAHVLMRQNGCEPEHLRWWNRDTATLRSRPRSPSTEQHSTAHPSIRLERGVFGIER